VTLVAGISKELEARGLSAGDWIRDVAAVVGGKGGGRPDMAQAGGKLAAKLPEALDTARRAIENLLAG
jgi:alanyl-tRNA synthetase